MSEREREREKQQQKSNSHVKLHWNGFKNLN